MTEDMKERIAQLREMALGHSDYFTPRENHIMRRRLEKAPFWQIGRELDCTGANANRLHKVILKKMKHAQKTADGMVADELYARKQYDLTVAYKTKNAGEMLKLLLPHINEIKELCK